MTVIDALVHHLYRVNAFFNLVMLHDYSLCNAIGSHFSRFTCDNDLNGHRLDCSLFKNLTSSAGLVPASNPVESFVHEEQPPSNHATAFEDESQFDQLEKSWRELSMDVHHLSEADMDYLKLVYYQVVKRPSM